MAEITTTAKQTYTGGTAESSSQIVGYANSMNRVVRFTFKTDALGSSSVEWYLKDNYFADGTAPGMRWYIGTSATSHTNAGASTTTYSGAVTVTSNSGAYTFSGSANLVLMPNTTYYLWLFPSVTKYGYYNLTEKRQAVVTTSGGAGVVYLDDGSALNAYQVYIDNGSSWDLYLPYVDNGSSWDMV